MKNKKKKKPKSASPKRKPLPISKTAAGSSEATLVAAAARALGLKMDPAWEASVVFNFQLIMRHAALVDELPLLDDAEPAPVFRA
jgi:1-carboxybiuret hydrolase subunit AtzG-like